MGVLSKLTASAPRLAVPTEAPPPPVSPGTPTLTSAFANLKTRSLEQRAPHLTAEIRRVCALPVVHRLTQHEADALSKAEVLGKAYEDGFRLRAIQADALLTYDQFTGPFCPIRVGGGKTLIALMIAERAHRRGAKKTAIFVPSAAYDQLTDARRGDIQWARRKVPLDHIKGFHFLRAVRAKRLSLAASGWEGCYIIPYSLLSAKDTTEMLEAIGPDEIIADEAHRLARKKAACTKRVMAYLEQREKTNRPVRLALMSGTISGKSIRDYWHLIRFCLKQNSPLPLSSQTVDDWACVLDSGASPSKSAKTELLPLIEWYRTTFPAEAGTIEDDVRSFRIAYQRRLRTAPGVVATEEGPDAIGTTLILHNEPVIVQPDYPGYKAMIDYIAQVDGGLTPNGDEIEHAMQGYGWKYQLTAGFYNKLFWNEEKHKPDVIQRSKDYLAEANAYHSALRAFFDKEWIPGLDTPMLVGGEMARHGARRVGQELYGFWRAMKDADFEGRVERDSEPVRVCDYKIAKAVKWAKDLPKGKGGLVWYYHNEIGDWLVEAMREAGLDPYYAYAGQNEWALDLSMANRIVVLSSEAHHEAKNLQHFHEQHTVQWMRVAKKAEQLLGRTHRPPAEGQEPPDELIVCRNDTTAFDHQNFAACLNDAVYIHETLSPQKLIYAVYDPLPKVYDSTWLRQNGFEARQLTDAQRKILRERFGSDGTTET